MVTFAQIWVRTMMMATENYLTNTWYEIKFSEGFSSLLPPSINRNKLISNIP